MFPIVKDSDIIPLMLHETDRTISRRVTPEKVRILSEALFEAEKPYSSELAILLGGNMTWTQGREFGLKYYTKNNDKGNRVMFAVNKNQPFITAGSDRVVNSHHLPGEGQSGGYKLNADGEYLLYSGTISSARNVIIGNKYKLNLVDILTPNGLGLLIKVQASEPTRFIESGSSSSI